MGKGFEAEVEASRLEAEAAEISRQCPWMSLLRLPPAIQQFRLVFPLFRSCPLYR
jgi:hypothetical protein